MSTLSFDGKGASFESMRAGHIWVVNKEPTFSTPKVVERAYEHHRERVLHQGTVLDTHVHIPEFMKNQKWRKLAKDRKEKVLAIDNEHFNKRLTAAETKMSIYTAANIKHMDIINGMKKHMGRLPEQARIRKRKELKEENKHLMTRLESARPKTSVAELKQWYQHHIQFKDNRRSDPTAGHIMKSVTKGLLPSLRPSMSSIGSNSMFDLDSTYNRSIFSLDGGSSQTSVSSLFPGEDSATLASLCPPNMRPLTSSVSVNTKFSRESKRFYSASFTFSSSPRKLLATDLGLYGTKGVSSDSNDDSPIRSNKISSNKGHNSSQKNSPGTLGSSDDSPPPARRRSSTQLTLKSLKSKDGSVSVSDSMSHMGDTGSMPASARSDATFEKGEKNIKAKKPSLKAKKSSKRVIRNTMDLNIELTKVLLADAAMKLPVVLTVQSQKIMNASGKNTADEDVNEGASVSTPGGELSRGDSNGALSAISMAPEEDCRVLALYEPKIMDAITLRVMVDPSSSLWEGDANDPTDDQDFENRDPGESHLICAGERVISAIKAKEIVMANMSVAEVISAFTTDPDKAVDVLSIRSVLMTLFKDADDENLKQLSAEKFKNALMKFDPKLTKFLLRLTIKELALVISEADGAGEGATDDGLVDYDEFVAFGADLLICLRGRDLGRIMTMKADVAMDANIRSIMHKQDLHRLVTMTNRQFLHADHAKTGYLKLLDVRPILFGMSAHGLSDVEIIRIIREMPKDNLGQAQYTNFKTILEEVRFSTLKQALMELRGTKLQRALLEECKHAEEKHEETKTQGTGVAKSTQFLHTGFLNWKHIIEVLTHSSHVELTKLQIMILTSEAVISSDNKIDYYKLIPTLANAMELLADKENGPLYDRIVEMSSPDFDETASLQTFTGRQLKRIAKKLLTIVKLRMSDTDDTKIIVSLPGDDMMLLATRPMELPKLASMSHKVPAYSSQKSADSEGGRGEASGNVLQIMYSSYTPTDLILRIVETSEVTRIIYDRVLSIKTARGELYKLSTEVKANLTGIKKLLVITDDPEALLDLSKMKTLLINMFREVDDDNNGYLTFDEFQELLHQMDLGVPHNEMRMLINESDENQDGVIQFEEFVPLAVDMIMTFTARRRAIAMTVEQDTLAQFSVYNQMQNQDISNIIKSCMDGFHRKAGIPMPAESSHTLDSAGGASTSAHSHLPMDPEKYVIKPSLFKQVLVDVGNHMGISMVEIKRLCQMMPSNSFGKVMYLDFPSIFEKMRFSTLKQKYYENQGGLLSAFLHDCYMMEEEQYTLQRPEKKNHSTSEKHLVTFIPTGCLDFADLRRMLSKPTGYVSLGKLQVLVIMSCFELTLDGKVDYIKYAPLTVNIIRMLNNPAALRQKAEIIESQDLSIGSLVADMKSGNDFTHKLQTLFKTYDTNRNGAIERKEFLVCLQSLGFGKTEKELKQIADMATDYDCFDTQSDMIDFLGFTKFFQMNLIELSKLFEIKAMKRAMTSSAVTMTAREKRDYEEGTYDIADKLVSEQEELALTEHLSSLFRIMDVADNPQPGFLSLEEVEEVLKRLDVQLTDPELKMLLPEEEANENELIDYHKFIPQAAKLLVTIKASKLALASEHRKEVMAEEKAKRMINTTLRELNASIRYIVSKVPEVHHETQDHAARVRLMRHHVTHKSSGITPVEARLINRKFFTVPGVKRLTKSVKELMKEAEQSGRTKVEHHIHKKDSFSVDASSSGLTDEDRMKELSAILDPSVKSMKSLKSPTASNRAIRVSGDRSPSDTNNMSKRSDGPSTLLESAKSPDGRRTQRGSMGSGFGSFGANRVENLPLSLSSASTSSHNRQEERGDRGSRDRTPNRTPRDAGGGSGTSNPSRTPRNASGKSDTLQSRGSRGSMGSRTPRSANLTPRIDPSSIPEDGFHFDNSTTSLSSLRSLNPIAADAMNQLAALEMLLHSARDTHRSQSESNRNSFEPIAAISEMEASARQDKIEASTKFDPVSKASGSTGIGNSPSPTKVNNRDARGSRGTRQQRMERGSLGMRPGHSPLPSTDDLTRLPHGGAYNVREDHNRTNPHRAHTPDKEGPYPPSIFITSYPAGDVVKEAHFLSFSEEDLRKTIIDYRTSNIMRDMLEQAVHGPVYDRLVVAFKEEFQRLSSEFDMQGLTFDVPPGYLPIKSIISVLELAPRLRVPRTQTMGMISMSDCYDSTGKLIHYEPFAEYVSEVLTIMRSEEGVESRTRAIEISEADNTVNDIPGLDDIKSEENLVAFIHEAFAEEKSLGIHYVTRAKFLQALHDLPGFDLSEKEILTIVAITKHDIEGDNFDWVDFLQWAYTTITSLCRERMVLQRGNSDKEIQFRAKKKRDVKMKELSDLSKKLLNLVRLSLDEMTKSLTLTLPWELGGHGGKGAVDFDMSSEFDGDGSSTAHATTVAPGFDPEAMILVRRVMRINLRMRAMTQMSQILKARGQGHGTFQSDAHARAGASVKPQGGNSGNQSRHTSVSGVHNAGSHRASTSAGQLTHRDTHRGSMDDGNNTWRETMAGIGTNPALNHQVAVAAVNATAASPQAKSTSGQMSARDRSQSISNDLNTLNASQKNKLNTSTKRYDDMQSLDFFPNREEDESRQKLSLIERILDGVKPSTVVGTTTDVGSIMVSLSIAIVESKEPKEATPIATRRSMFNNTAMANAMASAAAAAANAASSSAAASWGATTASHVSASHGHGLVQGAAPKELICKIISIDSAFMTTMVVPVNLPTIAMIDKESAEEFAANLCSKFYLEIPHDWEPHMRPELHMEEVV